MATDGENALAVAVPRRKTGDVLAAFGPLLVEGLTLYCLDGGNVFDAHPLVAWLRRRRADVRQVLDERIFLSRAFTCHQLAGAVDELLSPLLSELDRRPVAALILGVEEMFLDEDIRPAERRYLFGRILDRATKLSRHGLPVLITCDRSCPNPWDRRLAGAARMLPHVQQALPVVRRLTDGTHLAHV